MFYNSMRCYTEGHAVTDKPVYANSIQMQIEELAQFSVGVDR